MVHREPLSGESHPLISAPVVYRDGLRVLGVLPDGRLTLDNKLYTDQAAPFDPRVRHLLAIGVRHIDEPFDRQLLRAEGYGLPDYGTYDRKLQADRQTINTVAVTAGRYITTGRGSGTRIIFSSKQGSLEPALDRLERMEKAGESVPMTAPELRRQAQIAFNARTLPLSVLEASGIPRPEPRKPKDDGSPNAMRTVIAMPLTRTPGVNNAQDVSGSRVVQTEAVRALRGLGFNTPQWERNITNPSGLGKLEFIVGDELRRLTPGQTVKVTDIAKAVRDRTDTSVFTDRVVGAVVSRLLGKELAAVAPIYGQHAVLLPPELTEAERTSVSQGERVQIDLSRFTVTGR